MHRLDSTYLYLLAPTSVGPQHLSLSLSLSSDPDTSILKAVQISGTGKEATGNWIGEIAEAAFSALIRISLDSKMFLPCICWCNNVMILEYNIISCPRSQILNHSVEGLRVEPIPLAGFCYGTDIIKVQI